MISTISFSNAHPATVEKLSDSPPISGMEVILTILADTEMLGELSLIDGKPRSATAQTLDETETCCLSRKIFIDFTIYKKVIPLFV